MDCGAAGEEKTKVKNLGFGLGLGLGLTLILTLIPIPILTLTLTLTEQTGGQEGLYEASKRKRQDEPMVGEECKSTAYLIRQAKEVGRGATDHADSMTSAENSSRKTPLYEGEKKVGTTSSLVSTTRHDLSSPVPQNAASFCKKDQGVRQEELDGPDDDRCQICLDFPYVNIASQVCSYFENLVLPPVRSRVSSDYIN
jgi:hypothetical protein